MTKRSALLTLASFGLAACDVPLEEDNFSRGSPHRPGALAPSEVERSTQALSIGTFPVKPVATTVASAVAGFGDTAALWKNVDDGTAFSSSDNDTTYVYGTANTAGHGVRFAGGKAGTVSQVTVHYRARAQSATGSIEVQLMDGNLIAGTGSQHTVGSTWTNFSDTFTGLAARDVNNFSANFTLRRTSGTGNVRYTMVWIEATLHPITHTVEALLYKDIDTCVVGDACSSGDCTGLSNDAGVLIEKFVRNGNFRAVSPDDPLCTTAPKKKRVRLTMTAAQVLERRNHLEDFRAKVFLWSNGELNIKLNIREIGLTKMSLNDWAGGLWISPWNIETQGQKAVSRFTDFTIVSQGVRDATLGLHHDLGGCGGTFGADLGISGAGHSWIPFTSNAFPFECSVQDVYTHEWLHQSHWALHELSGFNDIYDEQFPACGQGDPDPTRWYPDTHSCNVNPDAPFCGQAECGSNDEVNSHVLGAHWKAGRVLKANHCRDGVLNHDETTTDVAFDCPAIVTRTPAAGAVTASSHDGNVPGNTVDNNLNTRWAASGSGQWLRFDLGATRRITHVSIGVYQGNTRRNDFDIQVSSNGTSWTTVLSTFSSGTTTAQEIYDFPDVDARYVRYLGRGNYSNNGTFSAWNSLAEVDIFGQ